MESFSAETLAMLRYIAEQPDGKVLEDTLIALYGSEVAHHRISSLLEHNLIIGSDYETRSLQYADFSFGGVHAIEYQITVSGRDLLAERLRAGEEARKQQATKEAEYHRDRLQDDVNRKKQFRHDWRTLAVSSVISFILGLIVAHFVDIAGYCAALFSELFH